MNTRPSVRWLNSFSDNLESKIEKLKWVWLSVMAYLLVVAGASAQAQQVKKVPRIGILAGGSPFSTPQIYEAFRQGLRDLGYAEGQNIVLEFRYGEAKGERLSDLAAELVHLKVDVIVTSSTPAIQAVKQATRAIPIVMAFSGDLWGLGSSPAWQSRAGTSRG